MAVSLKHATEAVGTDAGNGEIAKAQWNENHTLTGTANALLAFDGTGAASELTPPAGDLVGTTATQTLTNKTIAAADNTLTGVVTPTSTDTLTNKTIAAADNTLTGVVTPTSTDTLTNKTLTDPVLTGYSETVFALSGTTPAIDASNGTIQTWTLTGASTPTDSLASGESVLLMIDDGTANTITWTMVDVWETGGGTAPTLKTSGYTHVLLWKVSTTVYGALIGDPA